jgi:glycosyltransferase involved in cell wall biosynthesis
MTRPIRVLELRSVRGTGGGPEKTILAGAAKSDPSRFAITVCYVRDARDDVFFVDRQAAAFYVDYVELREAHSLDPRVYRSLRDIVRAREIDIIHAHDYKTDLLAWLVGRTEKVVTLSTAHGWTGHTRREGVYYYFDKRLLARFDHVLAVSREIRSELIRSGVSDERLTVVLNGIDATAFRRVRANETSSRKSLGLAPDDVVIGAVGRLEPQKRFDILIDVFAALRRQNPRLRLVIAGDGSLKSALQDQIVRLELNGVCTLMGHARDVASVHHAFDLFVQSSDYEGTPNAVLEAMALETPVVATNVGGTADLVRDGVDGLIVPPGHRDALRDAVSETLANPTEAGARVRSARHRVETDLSFEARMTAVESIYESLFQRRSHDATAATVPA